MVPIVQISLLFQVDQTVVPYESLSIVGQPSTKIRQATLPFAVTTLEHSDFFKAIILNIPFFITASSDRITYITDSKESKDEINNVGFCLTYTQKKC